MFKIRKVNADKEKIHNCIACGERSTSVNIESMFEITMSETKIYLCEDCFLKLEKTLNNIK